MRVADARTRAFLSLAAGRTNRASPSLRTSKEYQWGNLKADPVKLMERYFDAHLYFANWGTHRLLLRIPKARVALKALRPYFVGRHAARLTSTREHVMLDLDALGGELLRAFRATSKAERPCTRRTVGQLRALAETQHAERQRAEAVRAKKAKAAAKSSVARSRPAAPRKRRVT